MKIRQLPRRLNRLGAVLLATACATATLAVAAPAQAAATTTFETAGAVVGGTVRITGTGWTDQAGTSGSKIAVKIDDMTYQRTPVGAPVPGNLSVWAVIDADASGNLDATVTLPNGTDTTPAFGAGTHSIRLLSGSLKPNDTPRSVQSDPFTVTARPSATTLSVSPGSAAYGGTVRATVTVRSNGTPAAGAVILTKGSVNLGRANLVGGRATIAIPSARLGVGRSALTARFTGPGTAPSQASAAVTLRKAASRTKLTLAPRAVKKGKRATARIVVSAPLARTGTVVLRKGKTVLGRGKVNAKGRVNVRLKVLPKGKHRIIATYNGSGYLATSKSKAAVLTVR